MDSFYGKKFESIQVLRFFAIFLAVLSHIRFLAFGAFGVDIFFCISGFIMMYSTADGISNYWKKRLIRVLPLYYIMVCMTFFLLILFPESFETTKADPIQLIKSLLFIPFDIGGGILAPILRVGWTLYYEIFFYLVLFFSCKINHKYRGIICSIFLTAFTLVVKCLDLKTPFFQFYGDAIILEFALGIAVFYIFRHFFSLHEKYKSLSRIICGTAFILEAVCLYHLIFIKKLMPVKGFYRLTVWGIPCMIVVLCTLIIGLYIKMPPFLVSLGNISYSLYLIHYYPIMYFDRKIFDFSTLSPKAILGTILVILLCFLIAFASWYLIEKKLAELMRRKLIRKITCP